jgi:hypothetical protein
VKQSLFSVICAPSEEEDFREECAGWLGPIFAEVGVDYAMLRQTPELFLREMISGFRIQGVSLEKERRGIMKQKFELLLVIGSILSSRFVRSYLIFFVFPLSILNFWV